MPGVSCTFRKTQPSAGNNEQTPATPLIGILPLTVSISDALHAIQSYNEKLNWGTGPEEGTHVEAGDVLMHLGDIAIVSPFSGTIHEIQPKRWNNPISPELGYGHLDTNHPDLPPIPIMTILPDGPTSNDTLTDPYGQIIEYLKTDAARTRARFMQVSHDALVRDARKLRAISLPPDYTIRGDIQNRDNPIAFPTNRQPT